MDKETIVLQRKLESELKNYKDAQKGKFWFLCGEQHCPIMVNQHQVVPISRIQ